MLRVGLVLGGGGLVGEAFHRGVIRALNDVVGWDPRSADVLVGTSAGAIVAASLRASAQAGQEPNAGSARDGFRGGPAVTRPGVPSDVRSGGATSLPSGFLGPALGVLRGAARRPWNARFGVLASGLTPPGRRSLDFLGDGFDSRFGTTWPTRPLWVVAVERASGRRTVFGRAGCPPASVGRAVAASCALPGWFAPVRIGDIEYVDGGAHSPTNADLLAEFPLDVVVISSPMSVEPLGIRPRIDLTLRMAWHGYVQAETRLLRRRGVRVLAVEPAGQVLDSMSVNLMNLRQIDVVEELALAHAAARLGGAWPRATLPAMRASLWEDPLRLGRRGGVS